MSDLIKILLPLLITALLGFVGFLLNAGRVANCEAVNEAKGIMQVILLTVPDVDDPEYRRFLDRTLPRLEPRDCGLL